MLIKYIRKLRKQKSKCTDVKSRKSSSYIARIVFNEDTNFSIRKTWITKLNDTRIFIPSKIRKDNTGRKHLTNDINSGEMYNIGLLLSEPEQKDWFLSKWKRENTVTFRGYITQNNYITIPIEIRNKYNIQDGDKIQIAVKERIFEQETDIFNRSHVPKWMNI